MSRRFPNGQREQSYKNDCLVQGGHIIRALQRKIFISSTLYRYVDIV